MGVSLHSGTPKSSILIVVPLFLETPICLSSFPCIDSWPRKSQKTPRFLHRFGTQRAQEGRAALDWALLRLKRGVGRAEMHQKHPKTEFFECETGGNKNSFSFKFLANLW